MQEIAILLKEYWGLILFLIGLAFHAIYTYFRVGELEKHQESYQLESNSRFKTLQISMDEKFKSLTRDKDTLLEEISDLKEKISSMSAKLDILVDGYKRK